MLDHRNATAARFASSLDRCKAAYEPDRLTRIAVLTPWELRLVAYHGLTGMSPLGPPRRFDLYSDIVANFTEWPTRDHSIKTLARYLGFTWRDTHPSGAASIE
jgi:hypothetical protein